MCRLLGSLPKVSSSVYIWVLVLVLGLHILSNAFFYWVHVWAMFCIIEPIADEIIWIIKGRSHMVYGWMLRTSCLGWVGYFFFHVISSLFIYFVLVLKDFESGHTDCDTAHFDCSILCIPTQATTSAADELTSGPTFSGSLDRA